MNSEAGRRRRVDRQLLHLFGHLAPGQQDKLIAFVEFLAGNKPQVERAGGNAPAILPRPARETVTMAIRRLVRSYPMLNRRKLMSDASHCLAQYALEGRAAHEVIDDLEAVFARHYLSRAKEKGEREKDR